MSDDVSSGTSMELFESTSVPEVSAEELLMRNNLLRGFAAKAMVLENPIFGA